MVAKARFEETKGKELAVKSPVPFQKTTFTPKSSKSSTEENSSTSTSKQQPRGSTPVLGHPVSSPVTKTSNSDATEPKSKRGGVKNLKCFNCGIDGHMARNCPYPKQKTDEQEARGERRVGHVTSQEPQENASSQQEIGELRKKLQQAELAKAIQTASCTGILSVVQSRDDNLAPRLGPIVFAPVEVNGVATDALVDTGSPATIISLEFVLKVLTKLRSEGQTDQQW